MKALNQNQITKGFIKSLQKNSDTNAEYAEWKETALSQLNWLEEFVNLNKKALEERRQYNALLAEIHTARINVELDWWEDRTFFDKKWLQNEFKKSQA
jgi:hypothetical protein